MEREKLIERNVINKEMHQTQCSQSNSTKKNGKSRCCKKIKITLLRCYKVDEYADNNYR